MASRKPQPGDLIEIFRSCYSHWAIYVGGGYVIHLAPPSEVAGAGMASVMSALTEKATVKKELLYDVAGRDKYRVNNKHDDKFPPLPPSKIIQWAEELVGQEVLYKLTSENCEQFVNELRYGVARSDQRKPQPGDLIEIFRSCYSHWAIYVGDGFVIHLAARGNLLWCALTKKAIVKKELLRDVAGKDKYWVNNKHDDKFSPLPPSKIIQRAEEQVGQEVRYSLTSYNPEHFVNELRYGVTRSDQPEPQPGDLIEIFRSCYSHWAIYVGDGYVIHLTSQGSTGNLFSSALNKAIVKKELLHAVAGKDEYHVNNLQDDKFSPLPPSKIIPRAEMMVGLGMPYSLTSNNCEHFVTKLRYGVARSSQVRDVVIAAAISVVENA